MRTASFNPKSSWLVRLWSVEGVMPGDDIGRVGCAEPNEEIPDPKAKGSQSKVHMQCKDTEEIFILRSQVASVGRLIENRNGP